MIEKIDLKKEFKHLYNPPVSPVIVDIPDFNYIAIEGKGDPNTSKEYQDALETLYGLSYTIKFDLKKQDKDYTVMPLEGLWWTDRKDLDFTDKNSFCWVSMIMQPGFVTQEHFTSAIASLRKKKNLPSLDKANWFLLKEGKSAQIMHIGSFDNEPPTIEKLHKFIGDNGLKISGKHHEIYLSDFRKTAKDNLKTVIRYPVK
jgi:hypothetical protein